MAPIRQQNERWSVHSSPLAPREEALYKLLLLGPCLDEGTLAMSPSRSIISRSETTIMSRWALLFIVLAEVLGTSLWFAGTAALDELTPLWSLIPAERGSLLTAVQLGFIAGTLSFALSGLADRYAASRIFAACAVAGAAANAGFALAATGIVDGWGVAIRDRRRPCRRISSGHEARGELGARARGGGAWMAGRHVDPWHRAAARGARRRRRLVVERRGVVVGAAFGACNSR